MDRQAERPSAEIDGVVEFKLDDLAGREQLGMTAHHRDGRWQVSPSEARTLFC